MLEVTRLRLKGCPADDPHLLQTLSTVRDRLQTKSQFYISLEDPTKLYIFGIWRDLQQHLDFLASPLREEVLGPQEDMLDFEWSLHIQVGSMSSLPLDAPILGLERLRVEEDGIATFERAATRHVQQLQGSSPFKVVHGWRCDAAPASHEAVFIWGTENSPAHVSFSATQQTLGDNDNGDAVLRGGYKELLLHHCRNLERNEL